MASTAAARAVRSLRGLALGDAFGERFFIRDAERAVAERWIPRAPWSWTDDTAMALSVVQVLAEQGEVDQDALAASFAAAYDPSRGYGPAMHGVLTGIAEGEDWRDLAPALFAGQGSYGNGAAMRAAPLGAWFADDPSRVAEQAELSARVTHAHDEAVAGAVAVAAAAAAAVRGEDLLAAATDAVAGSEVGSGLRRAAGLPPGTEVAHAAAVLGNGVLVAAVDTVPFALWSAARADGFEEAMWATVAGLGDRDTTCAIVGGIFAARDGVTLPEEWLAMCEPLPAWVDALG